MRKFFSLVIILSGDPCSREIMKEGKSTFTNVMQRALGGCLTDSQISHVFLSSTVVPGKRCLEEQRPFKGSRSVKSV
jgi:hypothetical protein